MKLYNYDWYKIWDGFCMVTILSPSWELEWLISMWCPNAQTPPSPCLIWSRKYTPDIVQHKIRVFVHQNTDWCPPNAQSLGHHLSHAPFIIVVLMVLGWEVGTDWKSNSKTHTFTDLSILIKFQKSLSSSKIHKLNAFHKIQDSESLSGPELLHTRRDISSAIRLNSV